MHYATAAAACVLTALYMGYLLFESFAARKNRSALRHIVHVNGIRGKSSVTRMIAAGLGAGGYKTYCKTTGTVPSVIGPDGVETEIPRKGKANIKEQLWVLAQAAEAGADVLVIECMAVNPEYQRVSQHRMLRADIGVITNVRPDHMDVMGESVEEIACSLASTVPKNGLLFTAEQNLFEIFESRSKKLCSRAVKVEPGQTLMTDGEFTENINIALAVCTRLGVPAEVARAGIMNYRRDPYALSFYKIPAGGIFVGGLSINDEASIEKIFRSLVGEGRIEVNRLVLLVNNRADRPDRAARMAKLAAALGPAEVWLTGHGHSPFILGYKKTGADFTVYSDINKIPLEREGRGSVVYAVGNIADEGKRLMERAETECEKIVL